MTNGFADESFYPLEVIVFGVPISLQASNTSKSNWKTKVAIAARQRIRETDELGFLDRRPLAVTIYYFSSIPMPGDIDNIVKPIMDGLNKVAYMDDSDVEKVTVQKFEPSVPRVFSAPSDQLAVASEATPPVVYVRVDDDLSWRRL